MSVNYASKYSPLVDERFRLGSVTNGAVNQNYDWTGVQTVRVYSVPTAAMQDYERDGVQRYGKAQELASAVTEMQVRRDRSFTFTIDRGNYEDMMMVNSAGVALRRQIDEVVIPEIDQYRIAAMACGAGNYAQGILSVGDAYEALLEADVALSDGKVVPFGRVAFVSPQFYKLIKLDNSFVKQSDLGQNIALTGAVGMVDNVQIVRVPSGYLPESANFLLTHADAAVAPSKLAEYKIHDNPPGINGWLVEGRVCYDAFVLTNKSAAIYLHQSDLGVLRAAATEAGNQRCKVELLGAGTGKVFYKTGTAQTLPAIGEDVSSWSMLPGDGVIVASAGDQVALAVAHQGKAVLGALATAVVG